MSDDYTPPAFDLYGLMKIRPELHKYYAGNWQEVYEAVCRDATDHRNNVRRQRARGLLDAMVLESVKTRLTR